MFTNTSIPTTTVAVRVCIRGVHEEFNVDVEWQSEGYMVNADYFKIPQPVSSKQIYETLSHLLPYKHGPLNATEKDGKLVVKANQGYLYELNTQLGESLLELIKAPRIETEYRLEEDEDENEIPDKTSRRGLVTSRIGQGKYRRKVLNRWRNRCAVTGATSKEILIASHILPWRDATDQERHDVHNGLLLSPVYDALFDKHLISFNDDGSIILSKDLKKDEYIKLGVTEKDRIYKLSEKNKYYLAKHRSRLNR